MNSIYKVTLSVFFLLVSCASEIEDQSEYLVSISDHRIDDASAVYHYAQTALELGGGVFEINGHTWTSNSPFMSESYELLFEFTPNDYSDPESLRNCLRGNESKYTKLLVNINGSEPAEKLFMIMDLVDDQKISCWINPVHDPIVNSIKVFSQKK